MGISLIFQSLNKNVTKIAACYMWQVCWWLSIMVRAGSVVAKKTWLLIIQGNLTDQQYIDTDTVQPVVTFACQHNSIFKILYTGKSPSKQCWDLILAPIQSRPDLSSNKKYVGHPT